MYVICSDIVVVSRRQTFHLFVPVRPGTVRDEHSLLLLLLIIFIQVYSFTNYSKCCYATRTCT